ncbi:MAG: MFS transporter [Saprospiraceae bacterium]|nr:MAG: MFS transporter [Saprospiraceae bacterium]
MEHTIAKSHILPIRIQIAYACGMLGWSIMTNIIAVMLIYLYLPPNNSNLTPLVPQITVWGVFTLMSLIVASGRLLDAFTDPLIAFWSDKLNHPKGRRTPFMAIAIFPSIGFCIGMFIPLVQSESYANVWWLAFMQIGFYLFMTAYIVPFNAMLPELAPDSEAKVKLSTYLSLAFVLGMIISSQTPGLADVLQNQFFLTGRGEAMQWAIIIQVLLGGVFLLIPLLTINEKRYCVGRPTTIPLSLALRQILTNRNFLLFILADFAYFVSLTIVSSSLLYLLRVLLGLEEYIGGKVMGVMVLVSLLFYPLVVRMARHWGMKWLIFGSLLMQGFLLASIYFFGRLPISAETQIFGFAILSALPAAFLGILPFAIIAELARTDTERTGQQKEALFFAVRNFSTKLGQTIGIMIFAILTIFGKDPGNDLGIRLAGVFASVLCIMAAIVFTQFKESSIRQPQTKTS